MTASPAPETSSACPAARPYPFGEPHRLDVDPAYAELRETEPVVRVRLPYGPECWLVTRNADARIVLGDRRFSRAAVVGKEVPRLRPELAERGDTLLTMDPPEHSRLRKLVAKAFTKRRVAELRPRVQQIADRLADELAGAGAPADLVERFAMPLPVTVICELLGVPVEDRAILRAGADAALSVFSMTPEQRRDAQVELHGYLARLVAERRAHPTDDLLGALVLARDAEDRLTEYELLQLGAGILIAGHETTMNHISCTVWLLLSRPGEWRRLRDHLEHLPHVVEELLRFIPLGVSAGFPRIATEDVELSGTLIRKGEAVVVGMHVANRDPEAFDDPDELDYGRDLSLHLAFGHGAHHCLGAQLARMELEVAFGTLAARFPSLELAVPADEVRWRTGALVRGPQELPVRW